jgi:putative ABC transport system permease protein
MSHAVDIQVARLALVYLLLIFPFAAVLWYRVPLLGRIALAVVRMTVQLLFVGVYLQIIFRLNNAWFNLAWLLVMIGVADVSVLRGCGFRVRRFWLPLFTALAVGVAIPLMMLIGLALNRPHLMEARYVIPIAGMILGNCLRANIVGIGRFYQDIRSSEKAYLHSLAQGASLSEAVRPFIRAAFQAALAPTTATMATIGLVSLPGMMTGVILGGTDPATAIRYQIAIMLCIFSGTAMTVFLAVQFTMKRSFDAYGILRKDIFV